MLETLKQEVCDANLRLVREQLVILTWGNASARDASGRLLVIKPSGVAYEKMTPDDMVVVDLASGDVIEGSLRPSCDTATHRRLYLAFPELGGIVHTHSTFATVWAQARRDLPNLGTTQADYFRGDVPCTRALAAGEIGSRYEWETGSVIIETFQERNLSPLEMPAVLVASHGPFTWGNSVDHAVETAIVLEQAAKLATMTRTLNPSPDPDPELLHYHFYRKHGACAWYGQS
ncbi:MAG: L-ribulose-5-phosphate 4-epimerase AraD [Planctomycetia bacterium]|nr:L-ribulose-5-phosphate 4-epimerase AraD [Planctomycetia bacterium]